MQIREIGLISPYAITLYDHLGPALERLMVFLNMRSAFFCISISKEEDFKTLFLITLHDPFWPCPRVKSPKLGRGIIIIIIITILVQRFLVYITKISVVQDWMLTKVV